MYSFPSFEPVIILCPIPTGASSSKYRFHRRQVRWSGIPFSLRISLVCCDPHKVFTIVNEGEVDVFLEFPCLFYDQTAFGNLISGSSAFSKSGFYIWKFSVHVLLKPSLKHFEHYFFSIWNEYNCAVVWTFFSTAFLWDLTENWLFPVLYLKRIHTVPY